MRSALIVLLVGQAALLAYPARQARPLALRGHEDNVYSLAFSPDGTLLASASGDGTARLWDLAAGKTLHVLEGHDGSCYQAAFSPDGKWLATASGDHHLRLWEVSTGKLRQLLKGHARPVYCVAVSA